MDATTPALEGEARRRAGSTEEFEQDWLTALRSDDPRWWAYPTERATDQVSLAEWVKAQQVLCILRDAGVTGGRVLEYGCGSAGMSIFLKRRGYRVVALDRTRPPLRLAALNDRRHDPLASPLPLLAGDALRLPCLPGSFDVVMSYGLLEHFDESALTPLLDQVIGALRPGGLFVADIVPGRWNVRLAATYLNLAASAVNQAVRGRWARIPELWDHYFHHYYESSLGPNEWEGVLQRHGLDDVRVRVCRPFPPLAISGLPERAYVRLMRLALPAWRAFDTSSSPLARAWGWMYLASGVKPA